MLNRVMRASVIGSTPSWRLFMKKGITLPRLPMTFTVADYGEPDIVSTLEVVGRHEQFVRTQLGRTIQVDRRGGLVGRQSHHLLDAAIHGRFDDILSANDISLDRFERVVLSCWHLLQGGSVNDDVDPLHGTIEPFLVSHIADEVPQLRIPLHRKAMAHLELLELVAAEYHHAPGAMVLEDVLDEALAKGSGAPGDKH